MAGWVRLSQSTSRGWCVHNKIILGNCPEWGTTGSSIACGQKPSRAPYQMRFSSPPQASRPRPGCHTPSCTQASAFRHPHVRRLAERAWPPLPPPCPESRGATSPPTSEGFLPSTRSCTPIPPFRSSCPSISYFVDQYEAWDTFRRSGRATLRASNGRWRSMGV